MTGIKDGWRRWLTAAAVADMLPRASLGVGIGATVAMNVAAGGRGGAGGGLIGALIPVAFLLALETLIWVVRRVAAAPWGWAWCLAAGLPLGGLAAITGIVSYLHALAVAEWTGSTGLVAHLIPLVPDQLIVCGSAALMAAALAGPRPVPAPAIKTINRQVRRPAAARKGNPGGSRGRPRDEVILPDGALAAAAKAGVSSRGLVPWLRTEYPAADIPPISRYKAGELLNGARLNGQHR